MILAVGPFTALPPTMGDTATIGAPLAFIASRMPGTARIGSTLSHGFEGPMRMPARSAPAAPAITCGVGRAASAPSKRTLAHDRPTLVAHEILLEGQRARIGFDHRADGVVGHGQDACGDSQRCRLPGTDAGQRLARVQAARAVDVRREIAVAELEPGRPAERAQRVHEGPGLARAAPAGLLVDHARQRVEHGVDIGRDVQPQVGEVVAGVDDDGEALACNSCARPTASLTPPLPPDSTT